MDLPDLIATELIILDEFFIFIADYKFNHVRCPDCGEKQIKSMVYEII